MKLHEFATTTTDPRERGREIGAAFSAQIRRTSERYLSHFELIGIGRATVREIAANSSAALEQWCPDLAAEAAGLAEGADLEPWWAAAVGARTEILTAAPGVGECTTAVFVPESGAPETIQTWDWHDHLTPEGLLLATVGRAGHRVKLFTEFGTAAKIGLNDAGLGLHFNILRHQADHLGGGVPVHAVARRVLDEATTVAEAVELVASARVSASTVLTVVSFHDGRGEAAAIEMSPAGTAVVEPLADGWVFHTNHFLDPRLAAGDESTPDSATVERYDHARGMRADMVGRSPERRAAAFCGSAGADAVVCMRADTSKPEHEQWGTLLTASLDLPGFAIDYLAATPDIAAREGLHRF